MMSRKNVGWNEEMGAAHLLSLLNVSSSNLGEVARDLAYRLYSICDRKGWTQEAIAYNSLVISWAEISRLALEVKQPSSQQLDLMG
jgi:putative DNA methylase